MGCRTPKRSIDYHNMQSLFNRPGVAGAVLQTASSFIDSVSEPFPPDIHNIINPKPLELDS